MSQRKYNNKSLTFDKVNYKSQFEVDIAKDLKKKGRKKGGKKIEWVYEKETIPYVLQKNYTPDFEVVTESGKVIYIEVKGYFDLNARSKMIAVKECNPELDIRLIFLRNDKVTKRSKIRYSDWAEKWGFQYAIGEVPEDWLTE